MDIVFGWIYLVYYIWLNIVDFKRAERGPHTQARSGGRSGGSVSILILGLLSGPGGTHSLTPLTCSLCIRT